jgi:hypothetical protein
LLVNIYLLESFTVKEKVITAGESGLHLEARELEKLAFRRRKVA